MIIWHRSKPGRATPLQTLDGSVRLWWAGVYGIQIGSWFFGAITGCREVIDGSTGAEGE